MKDYIGDIVQWEGETWVVDNCDVEFKDQNDETSVFLIPEFYAREENYDKAFRDGTLNSVGYWVHVSDVYGEDE